MLYVYDYSFYVKSARNMALVPSGRSCLAGVNFPSENCVLIVITAWRTVGVKKRPQTLLHPGGPQIFSKNHFKRKLAKRNDILRISTQSKKEGRRGC